MDNIEKLRRKHIKKFRRHQWITGTSGVVYSMFLFIESRPALIICVSIFAMLCLAEEYVIDKIKTVPAQFIVELERRFKKWDL